jgi:hypothetical protein
LADKTGKIKEDLVTEKVDTHAQLDMGKAFSQAWSIFKNNWKPLAGLQSISAAVSVIFYAFFIAGIAIAFKDFESFTFPDLSYLPIFVVFAVIFTVGSMLMSSWIIAGSSILVHRAATGEERSFSTLMKEGWKAVGKYLLYILLISAVALFAYLILALPVAIPLATMIQSGEPGVGSILLFILFLIVLFVGIMIISLWLMVKLGFVSFTLAVEQKGVIEGIKRSFQLSKNNYWRTLGVVFLVNFVVSFVIQILTYIFVLPMYVSMITNIIQGTGFGFPTGTLILMIIPMFAGQIIYGMVMWPIWGALYAQLREINPYP